MQKKKNNTTILLLAAAIVLLVIGLATVFTFIMPMSKDKETYYIYIDGDDTMDSVMNKLEPGSKTIPLKIFSALATYTSYDKNIRTGRYAIDETEGTLQTFRKFRLSEYETITMRFPSEHPRRRYVIQSEAKTCC